MLRRNDPGSQRLSPPGVRVSMDVIMLDPKAGYHPGGKGVNGHDHLGP